MIKKRERYLSLQDETESQIDLGFLGKLKEDHIAILSAEGTIDPMTLERYDYALNLGHIQK